MPTLPVPIFKSAYKNVAGEALTDEQAELMDGYLDDKLYSNFRPGLSVLIDFTSHGVTPSAKIDGQFWWEAKGFLIVVTEGKTFRVTRSGTVYTVTNLTSILLNANNPVTFATDGTFCFMANGGKIVYTDGTATTAEIADVNAPTAVTHVAWLDGYLLANNSNNRFHWSNLNTPLVWSSLNFASAAGDSDNITSLQVKDRTIYLQGPNSLEIWENDGQNPFSRVSGGFQSRGVIAPYSVVDTPSGLLWIDSSRNIVRFNGRTAERVATLYDKELQQLSTISDCIATSFTLNGTIFALFSFPLSDRTFVLNQNNETWSEWGSFTSSTGLYRRFKFQSLVFSPLWGIHLVGCWTGPFLYRMSSEVYDDNGLPIRLRRLTGHIDYGTLELKRSDRMKIRMKRGTGLTTRTPVLLLRWRSDNERWSNQREVSLGDVGDTEIVRQINCLGSFRTRQYEFVCTDAVPVVFGEAKEDLTILA